MSKFWTLGACAFLMASPALASSGDAWAEFAQEVEQGCLAATSSTFIRSQAIVDPYGSENHGLALISGETVSGQWKNVICVFDKQNRTVEVGTEFDL